MGHQYAWSKFLVSVAILEIIIAAIAASGLGVNTLATTHGTADVILRATETQVDTLIMDLTMEVDRYHIDAKRENTGETDSSTYTYKQAYNSDCGSDAPKSNGTLNCNLRYAVWKWTSAFTTLGTIACVIVFVTGASLLIFTCCGEYLRHCLCGDKDGGGCCRCLCSCALELVLIALNVLVFLLFAFSWAILIGLKYANLDNILADAADSSLNDDSSLVRYDNFDFNSLKAGDSLWPLAVASFLSLVVAFYLLFSWCCLCCRCDDDDKSMTQQKKSSVPNDQTEMV
jgi:hypothetical protein